ncbi:hypothetical protein EU508_05445 [Pseudoalteromonas fuliginea]|uniref:HNH domain-containing protein n=1 Tax=Pseudoalteromonas fuliginea TaxID=1872678 RepID=A0AB73BJN3_9GAMM|nr:hypothetical protein [Pseudoalteromonas fuliginea]KAA1162784.1 hypothetical protein EU508_05445 [Pseudoalteromonas fuliginea]
MTNLFYPSLQRQDVSVYYKSVGVFYSTYNCKSNYENVAKDCQYRCVYCDALIDECGGEPFSLDHFRPQHIFGDRFDGILKTHPFNLHLSCQKCNVLKTSDWQGCIDTESGPTYINKKGYVDRFKEDITNFLEVDHNGYVQCTSPDGPAKYMIGKLLLNRTNRVYIRKLREVKVKARKVQKMILDKQRKILDEWNSGSLSSEQVKQELEVVTELLERLTKLRKA